MEKFQYQQRILIVWTKFSGKGYFPFETEDVNTIEFYIFKLV